MRPAEERISRVKSARLLLAMLLMPVLASCSGCSASGEPEKGQKNKGEVELPGKAEFLDVDTPVFAKQETPLVLKRGLKRVIYYAGKKGQVMTFQLSTGGLKAQTVHEWKMKEADNLRISISPAGKNQWKIVHPVQKTAQGQDYVRRQPLTLSPGSFVTVAVPLAFLESYALTDPAGDRLDVKAELNLASVPAEPLIYTVSIRPAKQTKVREYIFAD